MAINEKLAGAESDMSYEQMLSPIELAILSEAREVRAEYIKR